MDELGAFEPKEGTLQTQLESLGILLLIQVGKLTNLSKPSLGTGLPSKTLKLRTYCCKAIECVK